jgi:hypothetical protein
MGYDPSNPSSISCQLVLGPLKLTMITMLIQWGYDPSNPSSISCQLVLGSLPE